MFTFQIDLWVLLCCMVIYAYFHLLQGVMDKAEGHHIALVRKREIL